MYDVFGVNSNDGYPAVCGTRYVAGVGSVSEWMFCTDYFSHACSGVDAEGNLIGYDGTAIPGYESKPGNPRVTPDQEKLIAWLIVNGHRYSGTGYFGWGGTELAVRDGGSAERAALQTLIWCISDPADPAASAAEVERAQTCEESLPPSEQERLLAQIPDDPMIVLNLDSDPSALDTTRTAAFTLTTNMYSQPIIISTTGTDAKLSVISGPATLDQATSTLTVSGTDPSMPTTVDLGLTSTNAEQVDISAVAHPVSRTHLSWNQSPAIAADGAHCQVYAIFRAEDPRVLHAHAAVNFFTAPRPTAAASTPQPIGATVNTGGTLTAPRATSWAITAGATAAFILLAGAIALRRWRVELSR